MVFKIDDDVTITYKDDGAKVCLSKATYTSQDVVEIMGAGPIFVQLLDGKRSMDDMIEECIKIFGPTVEPYILAKDLENFIGELSGVGMVHMISK